MMWPALIGEFYGHFLFHYHTILLLCSYTRRLWEASLGKYDNWCLFIVIEICSTAQWNTTPQRLWLAAPGPETSKIIQISTTSSWPSNHFLMFYTKMRVSSHYALDSGCFPLCVQIVSLVEWDGVKLLGSFHNNSGNALSRYTLALAFLF